MMKLAKIFNFFCMSFILFLICGINVSAETFSNEQYTVNVPEGFSMDDKTLSDFTTFTYNNITIGISTADNSLTGDNILNYTEDEIKDFANKTLNSLTTQAGEGLSIAGHEIVSFSSNNYPALHVVYKGSTSLDADVYMEQYVITTYSYRFTLVFSADNENELNDDNIKSFMDSFTTTETPLKQTENVRNNFLSILLIVCIIVLIIIAIIIFLYLFKTKKVHRKPASLKKKKKRKKAI